MSSSIEELNTASRPKSNIANAVWNTLGTLVTIAISFVTAPVLINNLGTSQYGLFLLVGSITGVLSVMNFGLGEATLRYVARYYGERDMAGINRVFGSTLSFYTAIAISVLAVLLLATPWAATWFGIESDQQETVRQIVRLTGLIFALRMFTNVYAMIPSALLRYDISSKISMVINAVRSFGYLGLALLGFEVLHLVIWDVAIGVGSIAVWMVVARSVLPDLRLAPSFSFAGLRETIGYGVYSFLTWLFHTMHRESGKLLLGRFLGTEPVAFLGAPDSMAQRLHMVVATGSEALIPGFSAGRDKKEVEATYWSAVWSALAISLILLIPFVILIPDFLRLWINADFARDASFVGQLVGLYLISQGAFAPVAAYFRGIGKPGYVTFTILIALIITSALAALLIPQQGVNGAGWAYLGGSAAPFFAVLIGGFYAFGRSSMGNTMRMVLMPVVSGGVACVLGLLARSQFGELTWATFCVLGVILVSLCTLCVGGSDWAMGEAESPSRQLFARIAANRRLAFLLRRLPKLRTS